MTRRTPSRTCLWTPGCSHPAVPGKELCGTHERLVRRGEAVRPCGHAGGCHNAAKDGRHLCAVHADELDQRAAQAANRRNRKEAANDR